MIVMSAIMIPRAGRPSLDLEKVNRELQAASSIPVIYHAAMTADPRQFWPDIILV